MAGRESIVVEVSGVISVVEVKVLKQDLRCRMSVLNNAAEEVTHVTGSDVGASSERVMSRDGSLCDGLHLDRRTTISPFLPHPITSGLGTSQNMAVTQYVIPC